MVCYAQVIQGLIRLGIYSLNSHSNGTLYLGASTTAATGAGSAYIMGYDLSNGSTWARSINDGAVAFTTYRDSIGSVSDGALLRIGVNLNGVKGIKVAKVSSTGNLLAFRTSNQVPAQRGVVIPTASGFTLFGADDSDSYYAQIGTDCSAAVRLLQRICSKDLLGER